MRAAFIRIVLWPVAVIILAVVLLVIWVQGGGQEPNVQAQRPVVETPYRIYSSPDVPLQLLHFVSELDEINVSSSLVMGKKDAILFATQGTRSASERLVAEIKKTGRNLTHVYLGHPHLDHSQGASVVQEHYPNAKFVAAPKVAALQQLRMAPDDERSISRFGSNAVTSIPFEPLADEVLWLEGHEIQLWHDQVGDVGIGHVDEPHTVVYIPALKALLPNDIAYYKGHMMMGGSTAESRSQWKEQLQSYQTMGLDIVIPGHVPRNLSYEMTADGVLTHSLTYIENYEAALASSNSSEEVIEKMLALYPGMEHTSALYLGTYMNFVETHKLLFNPRLESLFSLLPNSMARRLDAYLWEANKSAMNP